MAVASQRDPFTFVDMHFPLGGIDLSNAFDRQPNRKVLEGRYGRTTPVGVNVRAFDPGVGRARGASRPALARYINAQVSGAALIQCLASVSGVGYSAPGGGVQSSSSGRVVTLVAVSGGNIKIADAGATSWTTPTGGTGALVSSGMIQSAVNQQKLYFADGTNAKYFDPATATVFTWSATSGSLPTDSAGNRPRLICTWRGRTVQSGLLKDPQNWFMSAVGDPHDWNYSPVSVTPTMAIAGNNSDLGLVGDVITGLVPWSDDLLVVGGDHTLWVIRGDPMDGGSIDRISDAIGMAWGSAWCKDPYGAIYFVSNRMGIYRMVAGQAPQRVSQPIEQLLSDLDTGTHTITMAWDDRFQGLHVFLSTTAQATLADFHLFWEQRTGAWWTDSFLNKNHNPLCTAVFDGNLPEDRATLIGSWDGYVRYLDPEATTDDGYDIASSVVIGPLLTKDMDDILLKDLNAVLGETSGDVTFEVLLGQTAEASLNSDAIKTGTWTAGRNQATYIQRAAHAVYVKLSALDPWAMEAIRARIMSKGKVAARRST